MKTIDAHIHLDKYDFAELESLIRESRHNGVRSLITVSTNLESCKANLRLAEQYPGYVHPAFGFHPEQDLPAPDETDRLLDWIAAHIQTAVAIGEVGLPYYSRKEKKRKGIRMDIRPYMQLLDRFAALARRADKPIVLHAVHEDADAACDILERHGIRDAHFHWFKGKASTVERMMDNGWYISITPDVWYEEEIRELVRKVPVERMMVETDGPWPFEGPFAGKRTEPSMIRQTVEKMAEIKSMEPGEMAARLLKNTVRFYRLNRENV